MNNEPEEIKPGAVATGDPKRIKCIKQQLKNKGIEQLPTTEPDFQRSVESPIRAESEKGPLTHLLERLGVGFIGSGISYGKTWLDAAMHFTTMRL